MHAFKRAQGPPHPGCCFAPFGGERLVLPSGQNVMLFFMANFLQCLQHAFERAGINESFKHGSVMCIHGFCFSCRGGITPYCLPVVNGEAGGSMGNGCQSSRMRPLCMTIQLNRIACNCGNVSRGASTCAKRMPLALCRQPMERAR